MCSSTITVLVLLLQVVCSLKLTIEPLNVHVRASVASNITVMCFADQPIVGCQFKVYENRYKREMPIMDLTNGTVSEAEKAVMAPKLFGRISGYDYIGEGLKKGQCGINITATASGGDKQWIIGCRVKPARGGAWEYQEMSVYGNDQKTFEVTRPQNRFIVLPGDSLSVLFKGEEALTYCHFQLPISGSDINLDKGLDSGATSLYHYHGESLAAGECGIMFHRVNEIRNGWLTVVYRTKTDTLEWINTALVVAKKPEALELTITTANMTENSTVYATCTVKNSRPLPKISWYIGDTLVRQDDIDDIPEDTWRWPYEARSMSQVLRFKLSKHHNKKEIKCMVEHVALNYAMLAIKTIKFYYPSSTDLGYELFHGVGSYKLHTEGKTWREAQEKCLEEDAHLAIINSEAEAVALKQIFDRFPCLGGPTATALLGFYKNQRGQFVTIFGELLHSTGYTHWSALNNQPDNTPPSENCGSVHRNGGLNDFDCHKPAPFFCEKYEIPPYDTDENADNTATTRHDEGGIDVRFYGEEDALSSPLKTTTGSYEHNIIDNDNNTRIQFNKMKESPTKENSTGKDGTIVLLPIKEILDNNIDTVQNGAITEQPIYTEDAAKLYTVIVHNQVDKVVVDEIAAT